MSFLSRRQSSQLLKVVVAALAVAVCGCGSDSDDNSNGSSAPARFAVLGAFPGEIAPHLARITVRETMVIEGHVFRVGKIDGVPVVLAMTGIGLVNAATTTRLLLEHFTVSGVVVSAVAGGSDRVRIGDVVVPTTWARSDGSTYAADGKWLQLAGEIVASGTVALERCTLVPSASTEPVCLSQDPVILVGGVGHSSDPYGSIPFRCRPNGGEVFGCPTDTVPSGSVAGTGGAAGAIVTAADTESPIVEDMETAAIGREALAHGVPFIAFRGVSDGGRDPLGLPNFLAQFNAYYGLAARNAAAVTVAFLKRVEAITPARATP